LYFNKLCVDFDITYTHTFIPAFFYVIIASSNYGFIEIGMPHTYAWLILVSLHQLIAIPNVSFPRRNIYMAALFLGIIALFVPLYINAILLLLILIMVFKTLNALDTLALLLGFGLPVFVIFAINLIFNKDLNYYLTRNIQFEGIPRLGIQSYFLIFPLLIFAFGIFRISFNYFKNNIRTRRMLRVIMYILLFHVLIIGFNLVDFYTLIPLLIIPFSVSFAYLHMGTKRRKLKSFSTILLIASFITHLVWQIYLI